MIWKDRNDNKKPENREPWTASPRGQLSLRQGQRRPNDQDQRILEAYGDAWKHQGKPKGKGKDKGKPKGKGKGKGKKGGKKRDPGLVQAVQQSLLEQCEPNTTTASGSSSSGNHVVDNLWQLLNNEPGDVDALEVSAADIASTKVRLTFDTGAAVVALPANFATDYRISGKPEGSYKTASAEIVQDKGARVIKGEDSYGNKLALGGRIADVHKPLIAGSEIAKNADTVLWDDGGYIMPKGSKIAVEMRKCMAQLIHRHGDTSLTPLYIHNGVYVMDYFLHPAAGKDMAPLDSGTPSSSSAGPNNAAAAEAAKSGKSRPATKP